MINYIVTSVFFSETLPGVRTTSHQFHRYWHSGRIANRINTHRKKQKKKHEFYPTTEKHKKCYGLKGLWNRPSNRNIAMFTLTAWRQKYVWWYSTSPCELYQKKPLLLTKIRIFVRILVYKLLSYFYPNIPAGIF